MRLIETDEARCWLTDKWNHRVKVPHEQHTMYLEELAESDVVESVGAVEDDALFGHGLGEILGCLCLTRPRGALGRPPQVKM